MFWQWTSSIDHSYPYVTGNGISCYCRHVWNYGQRRTNPVNNNWHFVKTDFLEGFFSEPHDESFVLVTHNADRSITAGEMPFLSHPKLVAWFAVNVSVRHPKLHSIPLGLANAGYAHGNAEDMNLIRSADFAKTQMFYANYRVDTNMGDRARCLEMTGVPLRRGASKDHDSHPRTYRDYLGDVARSYFVISPKGNGIDCHRHWEALYLRSIPVTTRSALTEQYRHLPLLAINDWSDFKRINFTAELYHKLWNNYDTRRIEMPALLERMQGIIAATS